MSKGWIIFWMFVFWPIAIIGWMAGPPRPTNEEIERYLVEHQDPPPDVPKDKSALALFTFAIFCLMITVWIFA